MFGHPRQPGAPRGGARVLEKRIRQVLSREPLHRNLAAYGELGRRRRQRVLLHGSLLREVALGGNPGPETTLELAVSGDTLGYAMALAEAGGGRWWPSVQGRETALVNHGGRSVSLSLLREGILPFLSERDFTVDGLGVDLTEPGSDPWPVRDAWGGLEDATRRRLVPSGDLDPSASPAVLLRGLGLELSWGLDPSPRLAAAYPDLGEPDFLSSLEPVVFWELLDPFLSPGSARSFRDGRLGRALTAFLAARGGSPLSPTAEQDLELLAALDRLEEGLVAGQVQERGQRPGAGLSSAARLVGLLELRREGDPPPLRELRRSLGRGEALARTLARVWQEARQLLRDGFPYRSPPPLLVPDPVQAAGALLAASLASVEPRAEDCLRAPLRPVEALRAFLGIRVPRAA